MIITARKHFQCTWQSVPVTCETREVSHITATGHLYLPDWCLLLIHPSAAQSNKISQYLWHLQAYHTKWFNTSAVFVLIKFQSPVVIEVAYIFHSWTCSVHVIKVYYSILILMLYIQKPEFYALKWVIQQLLCPELFCATKCCKKTQKKIFALRAKNIAENSEK